MNSTPNFSWLKSPVTAIRGLGAWHAKRLKNLGIATIGDLLRHFPARYEDFSNIKKIGDVQIGETCSVTAAVQKISVRRTWKKRIFLTEAILQDASGSLRAVWFNQPFLAQNIKQGATLNLSGKLTKDEYGLYFSNPAYEVIERGSTLIKAQINADNQRESAFESAKIRSLKHTGGLIPIYPETRGITSRMLRYFIQPLLPFASRLPDILPPEVRSSAGLPDFANSIRAIHFPKSLQQAEDARRRFAFEDILLLQLLFALNRVEAARTLRAPKISPDIQLVKKFLATLPFNLTDAQRKAAWAIMQDMARNIPMNRLLNGEVGSGKTVVATIAALSAAAAGWQAAMLAPTEILARQHFEKIYRMLAVFPVKIYLLISSEAQAAQEGLAGLVDKKTLVQNISRPDPFLIIGTHAILQEKIKFAKLGLLVVDEQHRFGVEQRAALLRRPTQNERGTTQNFPRESAKWGIPHLLTMTATPIPRTLALGLYGDLDISILDELPKGRQKTITRVISPDERENAYQFIRSEVAKGRQVFVVCPRIDPEERALDDDFGAESTDWRIEAKAVKSEFEKLSKQIFPDLRVAMLYGKMKSQEKESVMAKFAAGKIDLLVSTSVVEVGVDIPNASVMMIDGAERFGLAQLHQFRGRVGRGQHQSYCLLFTESKSRLVKKRLGALAALRDGFALAEKDLQIRGPGQFFGAEQSGLPDLAMRSLTDINLVRLGAREAIVLLKKDPDLKTAPLLKARFEEFRQKIHLE